MFAIRRKVKANLGNLKRSSRRFQEYPLGSAHPGLYHLSSGHSESQGTLKGAPRQIGSHAGSGLGLEEHVHRALGQSPTPSPPPFLVICSRHHKGAGKRDSPSHCQSSIQKDTQKRKAMSQYSPGPDLTKHVRPLSSLHVLDFCYLGPSGMAHWEPMTKISW